MGFSGYLLIVQDFINSAKEKNIPVDPEEEVLPVVLLLML